jgi:hypothetical protein
MHTSYAKYSQKEHKRILCTKGIHSNNEAYFQSFSSISLSTKIGDLPQK